MKWREGRPTSMRDALGLSFIRSRRGITLSLALAASCFATLSLFLAYHAMQQARHIAALESMLSPRR